MSEEITIIVTPPKHGELAGPVGQFLYGVAREIADEMRRSFARKKSGRIYVRSHAGRKKSGARFRRQELVHRASAPGEPPANDTGTLARSITVKRTGNSATIIIAAPYAEYLDNPLILNRPFVEPAIKSVLSRSLGRSLTPGGRSS